MRKFTVFAETLQHYERLRSTTQYEKRGKGSNLYRGPCTVQTKILVLYHFPVRKFTLRNPVQKKPLYLAEQSESFFLCHARLYVSYMNDSVSISRQQHF